MKSRNCRSKSTCLSRSIRIAKRYRCGKSPRQNILRNFANGFRSCARKRNRVTMSIQPWKVLESNYFRPRFRIDKCELPNGNLLDAMILELGAWANILALTKSGEAVLVKQYRHGVCEVLWELPGGVVEEGEEPIDGARRELLEETGFTAPHLI